MAKVLVWQTQLMANDFPPVCAMTGAPAETWRKFTFSKTPGWAFLVGGALLSAALTERISGYLPMTHASVQRMRTARFAFGGLLIAGLVLWIGWIFLASNSGNAMLWALFAIGLAAMLAGLIGLSASRKVLGPSGKLLDQQPGYYNLRMIEIGNVHAAFAAAVQQHQQMRAQQAQRQ